MLHKLSTSILSTLMIWQIGMSNNSPSLSGPQTYRDIDKLIPLLSILFIFVASVLSDLNYRFIEQATTLLFYAVLVQMWTEAAPNIEELLDGPFSHLLFLFISVGAVSLGFIIEGFIQGISGVILPAQLVALTIVVSRVYLKMEQSDRLLDIALWKNKIDRYVVLIPCLFVIFVPVAIYQFKLSGFLFVDTRYFVAQTTSSFVNLIIIGLLMGVLSYLYIEEDIPDW